MLSGKTTGTMELKVRFARVRQLKIASEVKPEKPKPGTFKRLEGLLGRKVFFEFRPLNQSKQQ